MRIKATHATLFFFTLFLSLPGFSQVRIYLNSCENTTGLGLAYQNGFARGIYKRIFSALR